MQEHGAPHVAEEVVDSAAGADEEGARGAGAERAEGRADGGVQVRREEGVHGDDCGGRAAAGEHPD